MNLVVETQNTYNPPLFILLSSFASQSGYRERFGVYMYNTASRESETGPVESEKVAARSGSSISRLYRLGESRAARDTANRKLVSRTSGRASRNRAVVCPAQRRSV